MLMCADGVVLLHWLVYKSIEPQKRENGKKMGCVREEEIERKSSEQLKMTMKN